MANKGVNKVIIIGHLGRDPEVRYTPDGKAIANLALATSESWKGQDGQIQEKTEWHRVSIFGKLAEIAGEYLTKGSQVYIEGKLQTRKWTNKEGQEQYTTEVVLDPFNGVMQMLGGKGQAKPAQQPQQNQTPPQHQSGINANHPNPRSQAAPMAEPDFDFDDDIPF